MKPAEIERLKSILFVKAGESEKRLRRSVPEILKHLRELIDSSDPEILKQFDRASRELLLEHFSREMDSRDRRADPYRGYEVRVKAARVLNLEKALGSWDSRIRHRIIGVLFPKASSAQRDTIKSACRDLKASGRQNISGPAQLKVDRALWARLGGKTRISSRK